MPYNGSQWDESNPTNNTLANEIDDVAQDIKKGVRGRMAQEHIWASAQAATAEGGLHKFVTFQIQTAPPALVVGTATQVGALYITSGNALIYTDSASNAVTVVASGARSMLPPGSIIAYGGAAAPGGYYLCDGATPSRTTDSALYGAIGVSYGTGNGSTTFTLPDIRGYAIVGKSAGGIFATLAASTGSLSAIHTHDVSNTGWGVSGGALGTVTSGKLVAGSGSAEVNENLESLRASANGVTSSTGSIDGTYANVQPSIVCNYIIAR